MTATLSRRREAARPSFTVEALTDAAAIRELLSNDRPYAAYALAQLDPSRFPLSRWYSASGPDGRRGLVAHSSGGLGRALFTQGDPEAVKAIISLHPGARVSFGSLRPEHRREIDRFFVLTRRQVMTRMVVTRETYRAAEGEAIRLRGADVPEVNRLYSAEGVATAYRPSHLEEGVYYGAIVEGRLVAIAGTHAVSQSEGVAVVGNVFTHPKYRDRGLSNLVTSAVTKELLETCPLVVLTVETGNDPAAAVYRRLGYAPHCALHESPLIRKEPLGALSFARRLVAAWRGRRHGTEVVVL